MALLGIVLAAGIAYTLWPNGEYRPIQPGERGTVGDALQAASQLDTGRPGLTPEKEAELGGAPAQAWTLGEMPATGPPTTLAGGEPLGTGDDGGRRRDVGPADDAGRERAVGAADERATRHRSAPRHRFVRPRPSPASPIPFPRQPHEPADKQGANPVTRMTRNLLAAVVAAGVVLAPMAAGAIDVNVGGTPATGPTARLSSMRA